jgi:hypothetical protein
MKKPEKTLKSILSIIDKDIRLIKRQSTGRGGPLMPEEALSLSRYAMILNRIVEDHWKSKQKAKKKFESMTTEELKKLKEQKKDGPQ